MHRNANMFPFVEACLSNVIWPWGIFLGRLANVDTIMISRTASPRYSRRL